MTVQVGASLVTELYILEESKDGILVVKNIWLEDGVKRTKKLMNAIESSIRRFARFDLCTEITVSFFSKEEG